MFRQNLISRVNTVAVKNPLNWIVNMTIDEYGLSRGEAALVGAKAEKYLASKVTGRGFEQIEFELIAGRDSHSRKVTKNTKKVVLTPFCYDDLELLEEFGVSAMQNGRIFRLIEEAYAQDALFSMPKLSLLTGLQRDSLRLRLAQLWKEGIRLPISGMNKQTRQSFTCYRSTKALEYLASGMVASEVRKRLCLTKSQLVQYKSDFSSVAETGKLSLGVGSLPGLAEEYLQITSLKEADVNQKSITTAVNSSSSFIEELQTNFNFSPAKAQSYIDKLDEFSVEESDGNRSGNTVIYFAISDQEPAGKAVSECELVPVTLQYYTDEEVALYKGARPRQLEWERIVRYTTQARRQGGLLTQSDLSFLLGVDVSVIHKLCKEHPDVVVPTRGQIADIGRGLTHIEKIIELYLQGYTESQIKQRTGHSYESIESYLQTFASVVVLADKGMPPLMIRKAIGRSAKLVQKHLQLYEKYKDLPDTQLVLMHLRNSFENRKDNNYFRTLMKGGDPIKRKTNPFSSLTEKNIENAQHHVLMQQFDFGRESWLARKLIVDFNTHMDEYEMLNGIQRLKPGDILTLHKGNEVIIPLLDSAICKALSQDGLWSKHFDELEDARLEALQNYDSDATRKDVRKLTNVRALIYQKGDSTSQLAAQGVENWPLVEPKTVSEQLAERHLDKDDISVPAEIHQHMLTEMTEKENISKERAKAVIEELAYQRALYCPLKSELKAGQVVWIGISTSDRQQEEKSTRYRQQVPLILTAYSKEEIGRVPETMGGINALQQKQSARMCVESYLQGAALTLMDLQMLLSRSSSIVGKLINDYMVQNKVIIPTVGTIKDAGTAMTHKHLVINLHMEGLYTAEIAKKTFHSAAAVDRYLDLFNSVLILYVYDMPTDLMARVTRRGQRLIEEHLRIVKEHFPDKNAVKSYLRARGVKIA